MDAKKMRIPRVWKVASYGFEDELRLAAEHEL